MEADTVTGRSESSPRGIRRTRQGFTLIELLTVLAVIAVLLTVVTPRYQRALERGRERALVTSLAGMRDAIDQFAADRGRYPDTLNELVTQGYLRAIPDDPMTGRADTWVMVPAPENSVLAGQLMDIHSGSSAESRQGQRYAQW